MKKQEALTTTEAHPSAAASMDHRPGKKPQCNETFDVPPEKAPSAEALRYSSAECVQRTEIAINNRLGVIFISKKPPLPNVCSLMIKWIKKPKFGGTGDRNPDLPHTWSVSCH